MSVNLVIDKGNTCSKVAVFSDGEIVCLQKTTDLSCEFLSTIFQKYTIQKTILSAVSDVEPSVLEWLRERGSLLCFSHATKLPFAVAYRSKETLGVDRLAAVMGATILQPNTNFVVVDCGTCITYELFVEGEYLGGSILPGMEMRFEALHRQTAKLPRVAPEHIDMLWGDDTRTSILIGVQNGIVYEIDGFINAVRKKFGDLTVFLTGGDAVFFEKYLKNRIFAAENLTLIGLNGILEYNA